MKFRSFNDFDNLVLLGKGNKCLQMQKDILLHLEINGMHIKIG